jgi:hypothetical protein
MFLGHGPCAAVSFLLNLQLRVDVMRLACSTSAWIVVLVLAPSVPGQPKEPDESQGSTTSTAEVSDEPLTTDASSPEDDARREAAVRYERGLQLYKDGEPALALIEFQRAYELVPDYRVLFNIGQVCIQLGRYAEARRALEDYAKEGADELPEDRSKSVQSDLEMLKGRTAYLKVLTNEPDAEIVVDGLVVGISPLSAPLLLDAGVHSVEVRKLGYHGKSTRISLAGNDDRTATLDIVKLPEEKREPKVVVEKTTIEQRIVEKDSDRTVMWVGWAATGTLALGAGVAGYFGITKANDLESMRTDYGVTPQQLDDAQTNARTLFLIADIAGAAAVVMGGVSLYLTLSAAESAPEPGGATPKAKGASVGLGVGLGEVQVRGRF